MLNGLRNWVGSLGAKILLALLILAFAAWGVADVFSGGRQGSVATVADREITPDEFANAFRNRLNQTQRQFGSALTVDDARRLGLDRVVLSELFSQRALDNEAQRLGLDASDDAVSDRIKADPLFQSVGGTFDRERYDSTLSRAGLRPRAYEETMRRELNRVTLADTVSTGTSAPRALAEALYAFRNERRTFEHVALTPEDAADPGEPTEGQLKAFHEANAPRFTRPETREVVLVPATAEALAALIEMSDEEVRAEYDARIAEFTRAERRAVDQLVLDDEAQAREVVEAVEGGESFAQVAEARGSAADVVTLGTITRDELGTGPLGDAAFGAEAPGIVGPVETPFGWAVVNVRSIEAAEVTPFEDVKDRLAQEAKLRQARIGLPDKALEVEDRIAGGAEIDAIADAVGVEALEIAALDATGRDGDGNPVEGVPADPDLLTRLFETEPGSDPGYIETGTGDIYAYRVVASTEAALRPLDEVREAVEAAWAEAQREEALAFRAEGLRERLAGGESLADVAADIGKEVATIGPVTRGDRASGLGDELRAALFDAERGEALQGLAPNGEDRLIGVLTAVEAATGEADAAGIDRETERLAVSMAQDAVQLLSRSALDANEVRVNEAQFERLLSDIAQNGFRRGSNY